MMGFGAAAMTSLTSSNAKTTMALFYSILEFDHCKRTFHRAGLFFLFKKVGYIFSNLGLHYWLTRRAQTQVIIHISDQGQDDA